MGNDADGADEAGAGIGDADEMSQRLAALTQERDEWQRERRELMGRQAVERQARRLGIVDEEAAWRLLPGALEYDEAGAPTNVEPLLTALVADRPWLLAREPAQASRALAGSAANPGSGRDGTLTAESLRRMTPAQINANWAKVQEALRRA